MRDGKSSKDKGYSLRDWFKGGGWKQTGGKYDGKPCAKQPGQTTKPYCRDPDDRAAMSKDERDKRAAKKRKEDPNPDRIGKAKIVTQEETKKDACYKKVKASAKVWPSAYASGRLVQCRKKGAANYGNKSESVEFSNWRDDFKATEYEFTDLIKPEPIKGGQEQIEEGQKCWKGYEKKGTKKMFGKTYNNCVKKEEVEQLDELSNRKLKSYAKKARKDADKKHNQSLKHLSSYYDARDAGKNDEAKKQHDMAGKNIDKADKRRVGAMKADKLTKEGYAPGDVDQKVGAVTAIPKKEQDAAKARLLAKAKAKREKMKEENEIDEAKHTPTKSDLESKIGGGNLKKLSKKASTRIDYDVDGDVDPQDKVEKSKGDYGEELPTPFGKFRTGDSKKVKVKKESLANWRNEIEEGAAWTKKSGKSESGGLNEKGRKSYERENPGSDLKAPSKKVGNPRRKSFCARMKGMKKKLTSSKTANDPDSRINKSLRAWNC